VKEPNQDETPLEWPSPLASSIEDYAKKRYCLESYNLRLWREAGIVFGELGYISPPLTQASETIIGHLAEQLQGREYL